MVAILLMNNIDVIAQDSSFVLPLWANGAPGSESRKNEPEQAKEWWVKNVHNPSITVFRPSADKANGTAILICPGGGHRALGFNGEGVDVAKYLNGLGITAFVLKYRLFREENSTYTEKTPQIDARRALQQIYTHAAEWKLDTSKIGMMGFSAGGEVVSWVAYDKGLPDPTAKDPIDRDPSKVHFQILIYPGPLGIPEAVVNADSPPAFLLAANDDACCSGPLVDLLSKYRAAKVPVELHLYAKGDHAFNMGKRSTLISIQAWPQRLADWLKDSGWIPKQ